jgi:hypothetical protein
MPFQAADKFRAAVRFGNLGAADRLLVELRREVEASWSAAGEQDRQVMAKQVLELLDWARQSVLAGRSHAQRKLTELRREGAYAPNVARGGRIEIEG